MMSATGIEQDCIQIITASKIMVNNGQEEQNLFKNLDNSAKHNATIHAMRTLLKEQVLSKSARYLKQIDEKEQECDLDNGEHNVSI